MPGAADQLKLQRRLATKELDSKSRTLVRSAAPRVRDVRPSSMDEFIATTGSGAVSTEPDAMQVSVAVEASAATVAEALATVAEAAGRATEVARRHTEPNRIASRGF